MSSAGAPTPAVFLDRDGTLLDEGGFLADPAAVAFLPGATGAVRRLNQAGYRVVLVTNQSGVARGLLDEPTLARIHRRVEELLAAEDARVDGIVYCPHHPEVGPPEYRRVCDCRKPAPGLVLRAGRELDLDLARSWVVGDALRDLEAGRRAGVPNRVLVTTGQGAEARRTAPPGALVGSHVAEDLPAAVELILRTDQGR